MGDLVNDLDDITEKKNKNKIQMASHYFQYMFVGLNGFCWPVAYYSTNNINGHSIYLTVWPLIDTLDSYGFKVHRILMDRSNNNHQFCCLLVKPENARALKYSSVNPYNVLEHVNLFQDCKHVMKKIRNSI